MTVEEANKTLIKRWLANGEKGFTDAFEDYIALDFIGYSRNTTIDFDQLKRLELAFAQAFPDTRYVIEDLIAENDKVVLRVTTMGTHKNEFYGIAPTNRKVEFTGIVIYRISNGKIVECWDEINFSELWKQITEPV